MGREIRMVPPNWKHPWQEQDNEYQPMFDRTFADAAKEWKESFRAWEAGEDDTRERYKHDDGTPYEFWEWEGDPPDPKYYRPEFAEEPTWVQVYQTVSEGTPVTPAFETPEELVEYLVVYGDFWDQKRGEGGWDRAAAESFVRGGYAPSFMMVDGAVSEPRDASMWEVAE